MTLVYLFIYCELVLSLVDVRLPTVLNIYIKLYHSFYAKKWISYTALEREFETQEHLRFSFF